MPATSTLKILLSFMLAQILSGCASEKYDVAKKWSEAFRELQMEAVFPPREDIQPGDVVLVCHADKVDPNKPVPISLLLARMYDTPEAIGKHLGKSIELPSNKNVQSGEIATSETLFSKKDDNGIAKRLRNVAFPDVLQVKLSKEEVQALLPAGVVLGNISIGAEQFDSGSISVPSAAEYGLPLIDLNNIVSNEASTVSSAKQIAQNVGPRICGGDDRYSMKVIQGVYVANTIRVQMVSKRTFDSSAQAGYILPDDSTVKRTFNTVLAAWNDGSSGTGATDVNSEESGSATNKVQSKPKVAGAEEIENSNDSAKFDKLSQELVDSLRAVTLTPSTISTESLPNVKTRISVGRAGAINMDRTFNNPVVVGYRSIELYNSDNKGKQNESTVLFWGGKI